MTLLCNKNSRKKTRPFSSIFICVQKVEKLVPGAPRDQQKGTQGDALG